MKAALNGALNCSILDGWWDERFDGRNGWAIVSAERHADQARRDEAEAASLFDLLEHEIVPLFYDRPLGAATPHRWVSRVKASLRTLGPTVSASRMVRDYTTEIYEPLAARAQTLSAHGHERIRALAQWKADIREHWAGVKVESVAIDDSAADLGARRMVTARVELGQLAGSDVEVQLLHGPVGPDGELLSTTSVAMHRIDRSQYAGTLTCDAAGRYGYTVRVVPHHPDLLSFADVGSVAWV
jgi:starch phosphorylase